MVFLNPIDKTIKTDGPQIYSTKYSSNDCLNVKPVKISATKPTASEIKEYCNIFKSITIAALIALLIPTVLALSVYSVSRNALALIENLEPKFASSKDFLTICFILNNSTDPRYPLVISAIVLTLLVPLEFAAFWIHHYDHRRLSNIYLTVNTFFLGSITIALTIVSIKSYVKVDDKSYMAMFVLGTVYGLPFINFKSLVTFLPFHGFRDNFVSSTVIGILIGSTFSTLILSSPCYLSFFIAFGYLFPPFVLTCGFAKIYAGLVDSLLTHNVTGQIYPKVSSYNPFQWLETGIYFELFTFVILSFAFCTIAYAYQNQYFDTLSSTRVSNKSKKQSKNGSNFVVTI